MFCKNKISKTDYSNQSQKQSKKTEKKTATTIMKKEKNNVNKKSLTVFEATELDCSKVF